MRDCCKIVARLLKKFHVWYALIARLFRDCCKIVHRKIVSISLRDCCKIVEKISRVICPNCKIVPRFLQDCCKIVENIHMCYVYSNNISWIPDAVEYILIQWSDISLCLLALFWSKTTLNTGCVHGIWVDPTSCKMGSFFLRSLALSVPICRNFQSNRGKWPRLKLRKQFFI